MNRIQVGIIEDEQIIRKSLEESIAKYPQMEFSFSAGSIEEALECIENNALCPDVILLDIGLPGMTGIQGIPIIKAKLEKTNIIMLTTYDENEKIFASLSAGACSYISKKTSLKLIMDSIFVVHRGGSFMSPSIARKIADHFKPLTQIEPKENQKLSLRQMEITRGIAKGKSYKKIAADLCISIDTVRSHIRKIYRGLKINSKVELINLLNEGRIES